MRRLVGTVVVLLAVLVGVDRLTVIYAQSRVAQNIRISQSLSSTPHVTIHGFPFLTQLVGGTYDDVELSVRDVRRAGLRVSRVDLRLHGVHVPFNDVVTDHVRSVLVDRVDGTVTIGYADLADAGKTSLTLSYDGRGGVRLAGTVRVAGESVTAAASGHVSTDKARIRVSADNITVNGQSAPSAVEAAVQRSFAFSVAVPSLPFDVELRSVQATAHGIVVSAVGHRIRLRALG